MPAFIYKRRIAFHETDAAGVVYFANFIGALLIVAIVYFGNMLASGTELTAVGAKALAVGQAKPS